jgi:hypothetical protein
MVEVYMAILLEETLTLYQRTTKERVLKINIGSKVNTNAITEANFKLQKDLMAWVLQKNQFQIIPLHNYSSLQMKVHPVASYGISEENRLRDQKEGLAFATASFNNDLLKRTAKASVNGNGIANKNFNNYTELKYETNTTAMANIGYKINSNKKK